jgi:glycosyltransferase involved in cell wall biosynthesis
MKNVLIISHAFYEQEAIGSVRIRGLAKLLPEFGWNPVILTAKFPGKSAPEYNVVETFYQDKKKKLKENLGFNVNETIKDQIGGSADKTKKSIIDYAFYIWEEFFNYPDLERSWYNDAVNAGITLLEKENFDAVISSSAPVTSHLIAKTLKNRFGTPWIADLRDLWTQNHYYSHSALRRLVERKLEVKTLANANALVTISPYLADKLRELHNTRVYSITNGFSDSELDTDNIKFADKFTITYTGTLYLSKRDPMKLFQALNDLILKNLVNPNDFEIKFFGPKESWLTEEIKSFQLEKIARLQGFVDRSTALKTQRESQLLLLLLWDHPEEKYIATGKLFDYLGSKRPILAIGGEKGFVAEILDDTNAGIFTTSIDEIEKNILDLYTEWKKNKIVAYKGKISNVNKYTQRAMAKKFTEVLNNVIQHI